MRWYDWALVIGVWLVLCVYIWLMAKATHR
jgi:hypothetical protein